MLNLDHAHNWHFELLVHSVDAGRGGAGQVEFSLLHHSPENAIPPKANLRTNPDAASKQAARRFE
jgi:hypothetical protein